MENIFVDAYLTHRRHIDGKSVQKRLKTGLMEYGVHTEHVQTGKLTKTGLVCTGQNRMIGESVGNI